MTEEEKNEQQEEATDAAEATDAGKTTDAAEAPAADAAAEEPVAAEEPAATEEPAPAAEEPASAEEPAAAEEPAEEEAEALGPKEARKRARSLHAGEAAPSRTPEERAQERAEQRRRKAAVRRAWRKRARERRGQRPRGESTPPAAKGTGKPKLRQGVVVSDGADKTITVRIDSQRAHRMYGKVVRTSATLHAHDEGNEAHVGDTVRVVESRPLSRTKRWRLVEILERAR